MAVIVLALAIGGVRGRLPRHQRRRGRRAGDVGGAIGNEIVEQRIPAPNSQVPQQQTVGIDLLSGWEGTLELNDVEIPMDQLKLTPELAKIEFTPGDGKVVEELRAGLNCVTAIVWPISEGRRPPRQIPLVLRRVTSLSGQLAGLQQPAEAGLVEDRDAQLLGLAELRRTRPLAHHDGSGLPDTLPGDLPPRALMAASASSRAEASSVPVTTTVTGERLGPGRRRRRRRPSTKLSPAARSRSISSRLARSANHCARTRR